MWLLKDIIKEDGRELLIILIAVLVIGWIF
jgi:hypothetical protein